MAPFACPPLTTNDVNTGDTAWVVVASALVLVMTPGLGFFYGGLVRSKNMVNTLMMSYVTMGLVVVHWTLVGYSFAFGPGSSIFGGFKWGGLKGVGGEPNYAYGKTIPLAAHMNFQMMFAIITPALISGGIVERVKFTSYLVFVLIWTTVVYDTLAHWMWGSWLENHGDGTCTLKSGWLKEMGALDFAGGTVIHISSGFSAFVAAAIVGKRHGYDPKTIQQAGNVPFVMLGAGLLWFGWLGFNGGSAGAANDVAVIAVLNTSISAAAAFTTWLTLDMIVKKQPSATGAAIGAVVGLVSITPASGYVSPSYAIFFGMIPVSATYVSMKLKTKLANLDDSLDVFYCHGIGGVIGTLLTGLFATTDVNKDGANGAFYGNPRLLALQSLAIVMTILVSTIFTALILCFLKWTLGLSLDKDIAEKGIDVFIHGERSIDLYEVKTALSKVSSTASSPGTTTPVEEPKGPIHYRAWEPE